MTNQEFINCIHERLASLERNDLKESLRVIRGGVEFNGEDRISIKVSKSRRSNHVHWR